MVDCSGPPQSHEDYTIACVCPMGVELAAVEGMLDEIHPPLPLDRDQNAYTLGKLGDHSIVVAVMPKTGLSPASTVATQLKNDFPTVRFALLVGIGGGVPGAADIRLGDVVVSQPTGICGGVVQYDMGKRLANGKFQRTGSLNEPPEILSASVRRLESLHRRMPHRLSTFLSNMLERYPDMAADYSFPTAEQDRLFQSSYSHQRGLTCQECDARYIVSRPPRPDNEPQIHHGIVASANVVVKDAVWRDGLKTDLGMDVLCIEMEAAGLVNSFPCLVIRGICDYADSHKNDAWQPYAAATAAAYMKELLLSIPTRKVVDVPRAAEMATIDGEFTADNEILASLAFTQMGCRRLDVQAQTPHRNTCRWILDLPAYRNWCTQPRGLLWIKGKPGSGKSTLMSSLYASLHDHPSTDMDVQLEFFFSARGTQLQHTFTGMLRSLLNQLFQRAPECQAQVRQYYKDKCAAFGRRKNAWGWHEQELQTLLSDSIVAAGRQQQVLIFVDALDEAGEQAAHTIAEYFHNVCARVAAAFVQVKICISCRHYPIISEGRGVEVCVENHNHADITAYIRDRFELMSAGIGGANQDRELWLPLQTDLIQRAGGVFQWICLATKIVEECVRDGLTPDEVWPEIQNLPEKVSDMYEHILSNVIKPQFKSQSFLLFQWACLAEEPLTVEQMRFALASVAAVPHSRFLRPIMCKDVPGFVKTDAIMRRRIHTLSGGLLEVVNDRVHVGHQTVRDFLVQHGLALLGKHYTPDITESFAEQPDCDVPFESSTVVYQCQSRLYWSCLKYLATEVVVIQDDQSGFPRLRKTLVLSPLLSYAARNVFVHAEKAKQCRAQTRADQVDLMDRVTTSWISVYRAFDWRSQKCPPLGTTPLHMAAGAGLDDIVSFLLEQRGECDIPDGQRWTPLHLAARWGHDQAARLLVDAGADVNRVCDMPQTPLTLAAANGHLGVVRLLLEFGARIDNVSDSSTCALEAASLAGHEQVVWALLASGIDANGTRRDGGALHAASTNGHANIVRMLINAGATFNTSKGRFQYDAALYAASAHGHNLVVELLIDAGVQIKSQKECYSDALYAASTHGHERIAGALIAAGADVNRKGGAYYGNMLEAASANGHVGIVQMLINAGAHVNAQDGYYGNALYAASKHGQERVAVVLIAAGANINEQGGRYYGSALEAASANGHVGTAQMLINAGARINAQNEHRGNALYAASKFGHERVVVMLIAAGANVNERGGRYYGSALEAASASGHDEIVQVLVNAGAHVNARGSCYRGALRVAAEQGHARVVQTLIAAGADVNAQKGTLNNALHVASVRGHAQVVQMLVAAGANINA